MNNKAEQFLNDIAKAEDNVPRGSNVTLPPETLAVVDKWRVGKASNKETIARLVDVADATLTEIKAQHTKKATTSAATPIPKSSG